MKTGCEKWKDQLLEAALQGDVAKDLEEHLRTCKGCSAELKHLAARRAQLDALLPMVAQGAEPSAGFRERVIAAAEADCSRKRPSGWRAWTLAGTLATAVTVLVFGVMWHRATEQERQAARELVAAQKLAEWRAPSDTLLATPGQELLRTTPKLGETYLKFPANKGEED